MLGCVCICGVNVSVPQAQRPEQCTAAPQQSGSWRPPAAAKEGPLPLPWTASPLRRFLRMSGRSAGQGSDGRRDMILGSRGGGPSERERRQTPRERRTVLRVEGGSGRQCLERHVGVGVV